MKFVGVAVVGLLIGLVGGLIYTWFVAPVEYYDTYPPMLVSPYRQDWIRMTAWAYGLGDDWERTQTRLINLSHLEIAPLAVEVLEQAAAHGHDVTVLERIARLASSYGADGPGIAIYAEGNAAAATSPENGPSSPTATPVVATSTPRPTPLPTQAPTIIPTPATLRTSPFRIITQTLSCDAAPSLAVSLELSRTIESRGREVQEQVGLPMRQVWLTWDDGADRAITGFKPAKGLGYADFQVRPGRKYNLYIDSPGGLPVLSFQVEPCPPSEGDGWVSRYLVLLEERSVPSETLRSGTVLTATGPLTAAVPLTLTQPLTRTQPLTLTEPLTLTNSLTATRTSTSTIPVSATPPP